MKIKKSIHTIFVKTVGQYINFLFLLHPKKAIELSYTLFTNPRKGKITKDYIPWILKNAHTEQIQHNDEYFQTYVWKGNAIKILLVHGWESNSARWKKMLPQLKKSGATIIALDAPAHGQSSGKEFNVSKHTDFIKKVVDLHQPSIIIGHSIGGASCLYHQYLYPKSSIKKMVILGAPSDLKTLIEHYFNLLSISSKLYPHLKNRYIQNFKEPMIDFSLAEVCKLIDIEGIIAHDINDAVVSYKEGEKIANAWAKGRFITTNHLGHAMHDATLYLEIYNFLFPDKASL